MTLIPTIWNASDKNVNITLSLGNLRATSAGDGYGVRSISSASSGKFYFETTLGLTNSIRVGIANSSTPLSGTTYASSVSVSNSGTVYVNATTTGISIGNIPNGSVACVAIDLDNRSVWFRVGAAGNWNGSSGNNPATNTGGVAIPVGTTYPMFAYVVCSTSDVAIANFGASAFTGTAPSGFSAGFGSDATLTLPPTTWNPSDKAASLNLTNGNLTDTSTSSAGSANVRSIFSASTGKWFWEYTLTTVVSGYLPGIANNVIGLTAAVPGTGACVVNASGALYVNTTSVLSFTGGLASGNTFAIAVDIGAKRLWIKYGSTNWNNNVANDPATGVGGVDISALASPPYYAFASIGVTGGVLTANFGASTFVNAVPSGFQPGFGAPTSAQLTQAALEQWFMPNANAQATQAAIEMWGSAGATASRAITTQVALEEWGVITAIVPATTQARVWVMA